MPRQIALLLNRFLRYQLKTKTWPTIFNNGGVYLRSYPTQHELVRGCNLLTWTLPNNITTYWEGSQHIRTEPGDDRQKSYLVLQHDDLS